MLKKFISKVDQSLAKSKEAVHLSDAECTALCSAMLFVGNILNSPVKN